MSATSWVDGAFCVRLLNWSTEVMLWKGMMAVISLIDYAEGCW